ncbi:AEC family transporter [Mycolicibacterium sp. S2-37]|uniref:AEC family transporter n=1 Tax=Mycolicibacterium sp. S2-37 TaxID=2810297 RepID=UPI001A953BCB|nr:AEC family transporter [Mycolicibacterium sp. S2-37]MBO0680364.1 AEC family transporter [Mycolicibacterium sp. S2-37]
MLAVLEAFAVIGVVIGVGAIVGRTGVLGENARVVLNRVAFHIGVPALLLLTLSRATLDQIFSLPLLVSALACFSSFAMCYAVFTLIRRRARGDATIASWTGSYVNAGNLGIPLSAYVFGDTTAISAIILFQSVVMAPVGVAILTSDVRPRPSAGRQLKTLVTNPIIAASAIGLALAATGLDISGPLADPFELLADLAIPTVLLAFGISLTAGIGEKARADRLDVGIASAFKLVAMPAVAYALARWVFGADDEQLLLVTVLAALPSAQNINAYASVYRRSESLARDVTLITTAVSVPVITAVVAVLS